jgi:hypothetical protein
MLQYALAALIIGVMLVLCIDIVRRNNKTVHFGINETNTEIEETLTRHEKSLAYPFYVDCFRDIERNYSSQTSQEINTKDTHIIPLVS